MALYGAYQRITTGNVQTTVDSSTVPLNGPPKQPLGTIYSPPINVGIATAAGAGAPPVYKYVQYQSTTNPAVVAAPAPVYYTDETYTIVSGNAAEAYITTAGVSIAGYLMPNTTALSTLTAALLNGNWVWIQIAGFLKGAWGPTTGGGATYFLTGLTTANWASDGIATAPTSRVLGIQLTAVSSSVCDVLVNGYGSFWGS
jgi:hypothetical protein